MRRYQDCRATVFFSSFLFIAMVFVALCMHFSSFQKLGILQETDGNSYAIRLLRGPL